VTTEARRTRRVAAVLGLGLLAGALIAGCGGSSGDAAASSAAAPSTSAGNTQTLLDGQQLTVLDQSIAYPKKKPAKISSSITALEPGQETGWHKYNAPVYAYVLDGALTVEYDAGVTKEYPAGTALMQAQGVWLNAMNKGDQAVHVLVVNMGAKGVKNRVQRSP
jgi:quercetin dioxygenase-like cupin family protein